MANTNPHVDQEETLSYVLEKGAKTGIHVYTCANVTMDMEGDELTDMEALAKAGDVLAMYEMADVYRVGLVRKANEKKRWAWNKKCMKAGLWQSRIRWASHLIFDQTLAAEVGADGEALLKEIAEEPKASAGEAARLLAEHYLFQQDFKRSFYYSELAVRMEKYLGLVRIWGFIMRMATA